MSDDPVAEPPVQLFGDPRSALIERGPDRRSQEHHVHRADPVPPTASPARPFDAASALRTGRGDGFATTLMVVGVIVFAGTVIAGTLILYNAKNVGAFSNPWDSTRVAIGLAVLAVGITQSVILVGLSRVTSYLLAIMRMRNREANYAAGINHQD